ncbi:GNAT family N-acetyltransferase [Oscillospiraceae bacterium PP1C4]
MFIKQATAQDAKTISHIHASSWKAAYRGMIPQQYLDELQDDFWVSAFQSWIDTNPIKALLIYDNELPVGCIVYGKSRDDKLPEWGEIISIYLIPAYLGKGYGYKLFNSALDDMKHAGYHDIYLWVLEDNEAAKKFYERNGFVCNNDKYSFEIMNKPIHDVRYVFSFNNPGL